MVWIRRSLLKLLELGLGLKPYFKLETLNPLFLNFKLQGDELERLRRLLPPGYEPEPLRFMESDDERHHRVSLNVYEVVSPDPRLRRLTRSRLEINAFVRDSEGSRGILVFHDSPFVSRSSCTTFLARRSDAIEQMVIALYGCGSLRDLSYELQERSLGLSLSSPSVEIRTEGASLPILEQDEGLLLAADVWRFNDNAIFNGGRTRDFVFVNSSFRVARFQSLPVDLCRQIRVKTKIFERSPDEVLWHRGPIDYLVCSLNAAEAFRVGPGTGRAGPSPRPAQGEGEDGRPRPPRQ